MKEGICSVKKQDGSLTTTDSETANVLNEAFQSVFTKEILNSSDFGDTNRGLSTVHAKKYVESKF